VPFFIIVRILSWRARWREGWSFRHDGVPPAFEEWHRRAHAERLRRRRPHEADLVVDGPLLPVSAITAGRWRTIDPLTQSCAEPTPGINDARENGADDADHPE
jgi:hypothetical protein